MCQHLDDVVGVGSPDGKEITEFDTTYRDVAGKLGVRLASREDPDKSFAPSTSGLVLGISYDTKTFTWKIREDKLARILLLLSKVTEGLEVSVGELLSLQGKLVDIRFLVPGGKYNLAYILGDANSGMDKESVAMVGEKCRQQCYWWILHLQTAAFSSKIVRPNAGLSPGAVRG